MIKKQQEMLDRCITHVRASFRQGTMKGLDREVLSRAFIIESMIEIFGVEPADAIELASNCVAEAVQKRQFDLLTASNGGLAHE